jgi:hypothetical protein
MSVGNDRYPHTLFALREKEQRRTVGVFAVATSAEINSPPQVPTQLLSPRNSPSREPLGACTNSNQEGTAHLMEWVLAVGLLLVILYYGVQYDRYRDERKREPRAPWPGSCDCGDITVIVVNEPPPVIVVSLERSKEEE